LPHARHIIASFSRSSVTQNLHVRKKSKPS
jgi:hypothetical protein